MIQGCGSNGPSSSRPATAGFQHSTLRLSLAISMLSTRAATIACRSRLKWDSTMQETPPLATLIGGKKSGKRKRWNEKTLV
eukprot:3755865-Amphidinium_carterae.1